MSSKDSGVIFLLRDKFYIYTTLLPNILEFKFVPDIVRDLEIVNKDLLFSILNLFIQTNKIGPCVLTIVLADNTCFIKDFVKSSPPPTPAAAVELKSSKSEKGVGNPELDKQIEEFLQHIPFEQVAGVNQDLQNGIRVFATNQDLYDSLKFVFEKQGSTINSVIPGAIFGNNTGTQLVLTPSAAAYILQSTPQLKKYNLLVQSMHEHEMLDMENEKDEIEIQTRSKSKKNSKRIILLSAVFGLLLLVLVIVYFVSNPNPDTSLSTNANQPISTVETINPPPQ